MLRLFCYRMIRISGYVSNAVSDLFIILLYYMALACGRYNVRSDRLRMRSEWSLCSCNAHRPITDYAN